MGVPDYKCKSFLRVWTRVWGEGEGHLLAVSIIPIKLLVWILRLRRGSIWPPDSLEISPTVGCQQSRFLSHWATRWDQWATCFGNPPWGSPLPCTVPSACPRMNPAPQGSAPMLPQDTLSIRFRLTSLRGGTLCDFDEKTGLFLSSIFVSTCHTPT